VTAYVIGFAGSIASGKSTLSAAVARELGWVRASFGNSVRDEARQRGLDPVSREVLQALGAELIEAGWRQFCWSLLQRAGWHPGQNLVIDGVRHVKAVETLRSQVNPATFHLIYLDVPDGIREQRLYERGIGLQEQRQVIDWHSTEIEVQTALAAIADVHLSSDMNLNENMRRVLAAVFSQDKC